MWNLKAPCTSRNDGHCSAVDHNFLIIVTVTEDGNAATTFPSKLVEGHTMIFTGQFTGTTINLDSNNISQECNYVFILTALQELLTGLSLLQT